MTKTTARWNGWFAFIIGLIAICILVGLLGVWGMQSRIAGAVIAPGVIKVESNRQVIQHPDGGIVSEIFVRNGDVVQAGEVLLRLDETDIRSELAIIEQQLVELIARIARLKAERDSKTKYEVSFSGFEHISFEEVEDGQRRLFDARKSSLENELAQVGKKITQTQSQVGGVEAQIKAIEVQLDLLEQEIQTNEQLQKQGLLLRSKMHDQLRDRARMQGERGRLVAQKGQYLNAIAELEISKISLQSGVREKAITKLRDLESDLSEQMEKRGILARKLSRMEIIAPVDGIIFGSSVFALKSVIQKGKDIMYIVPKNQALVISARVPASDVDQVSPGQEVSLRFNTLDQRFTPEIFGLLNFISADSVTEKSTGQAYYEAEISPLETEVAKLGDQVLVPGMPVETYIQTGERAPLSYLTKPFADYFYRAFREQ